jgi:hypothetical protein
MCGSNFCATEFLYGFCSSRLLEILPEEMLWTILSFCDVRTLCTARLVCSRFRESATSHLSQLHLDSRSLEEDPIPEFRHFVGLTLFAVSCSEGRPLALLTHPIIAQRVSHVYMDCTYDPQDGAVLASLRGLPKFRSLSLCPVEGGQFDLSRLPSGLVNLNFAWRWPSLGVFVWAGMQDATPLTRFSNLESLTTKMDVGTGPSLGALMSLQGLKSLDISTCPSAVGVVKNMTQLTALTWTLRENPDEGKSMFDDLGHLSGLLRLHFSCPGDVMHKDLALLGPLITLTHLCLGALRKYAECAARSHALVRLTNLKSVELEGRTLGKSLVSRLKLETLNQLTLSNVDGDVGFLQRATGLTSLSLDADTSGRVHGLGSALSRMTGLRCLWLGCHNHDGGQLSSLLRGLIKLTKLCYRCYRGEFDASRGLAACASLPGLRSLCLSGRSELTPSYLPVLQNMSGLTELTLDWTGISPKDLTPDVLDAFNFERRRRGWPSLKLKCLWVDVNIDCGDEETFEVDPPCFFLEDL